MVSGLNDIQGNPLDILSRLGRSKAFDVIFDVGAYRGVMTDALLERFPEAHYFLFEPLPYFSDLLRRKFAVNHRLKVFDCALLNRNGETDFHIGHFEPTSSVLPRSVDGKRYYHPDHTMRETIRVRARRLDEVCAENGVDHINLLKLDTQGSELWILEGADELLAGQAIDVIYTEFFAIPHYQGSPLLDEIWGFLRRRNYELYDIFSGPRGADGQLRYGDAIFLSQAFRSNGLPDRL